MEYFALKEQLHAVIQQPQQQQQKSEKKRVEQEQQLACSKNTTVSWCTCSLMGKSGHQRRLRLRY